MATKYTCHDCGHVFRSFTKKDCPRCSQYYCETCGHRWLQSTGYKTCNKCISCDCGAYWLKASATKECPKCYKRCTFCGQYWLRSKGNKCPHCPKQRKPKKNYQTGNYNQYEQHQHKWQYSNPSGSHWRDYDTNTCLYIEQHYLSKIPTFDATINGNKYRINLEYMIQSNNRTGKARSIQRIANSQYQQTNQKYTPYHQSNVNIQQTPSYVQKNNNKFIESPGSNTRNNTRNKPIIANEEKQNKNDLFDDFIKGLEDGKEEKRQISASKDSVKKQFKIFLEEMNMEQYLKIFEENDCCDMDSISIFNDELLKDIITKAIPRRKFLVKCQVMIGKMNEFKNEYGISSAAHKQLAKYGIVTFEILCAQIKSKCDLKYKYQIQKNNDCDLLWNMITMDKQPQFEGDMQTPYLF